MTQLTNELRQRGLSRYFQDYVDELSRHWRQYQNQPNRAQLALADVLDDIQYGRGRTHRGYDGYNGVQKRTKKRCGVNPWENTEF